MLRASCLTTCRTAQAHPLPRCLLSASRSLAALAAAAASVCGAVQTLIAVACVTVLLRCEVDMVVLSNQTNIRAPLEAKLALVVTEDINPLQGVAAMFSTGCGV
jgi:hypothetical protein